MFNNYKVISVTVLMLFSLQVNAFRRKSGIKSDIAVVLSDLPSHKDLHSYMSCLERVINYCLANQNILDLNFVFGLFLVKVNLGPFVNINALPMHFRNDLRELLLKYDKLLHYHIVRMQMFGSEVPKISAIAFLFSNDTAWSEKLVKFNLDLLKKTSLKYYEAPDLRKYVNEVMDIDKWIPSPGQSDVCVGSISSNRVNVNNDPNYLCQLPGQCHEVLMKGTDFGYGLTHRILILLQARLGRGCSIFSPFHDQLLRSSLCEKAYLEGDYIANNSYELVDLLFEQTALCTLDGHGQFLRKSWISSLLQLQIPEGCFIETFDYSSNSRKGNLSNLSNYDAHELQCNAHTTAVASATVASAVRFILESE